MNTRIMAFVVASALSIAPAIAGPCSVEVTQFRNLLPALGEGETVGSAPQTVAAQLGHQPTRASVEQAERNAQAGVTAALAEADKLDAEGNQSACEDALARAKLLANP